MSYEIQRRTRLIAVATAAISTMALASASEVQPRIELPDKLGVPVAILAPELPGGALKEGERAEFEIEFRVNLRGEVTASKVVSTNRPDLAEGIQTQHNKWLYAVATRGDPCSASRYQGLQSIKIERREGRLLSPLEPASVLVVERRAKLGTSHTDSNFEEVMSKIKYPSAALRAGIEARFALILQFEEDGSVKEVYPVNSAYDSWGFAQSAIEQARAVRLNSPSGRLTVCAPVEFRLR